jgi:heptaprenyl diphosphate synthase
MQLQDKYRIALLSAYAIALHGFESLLPTPIPWLRLGLANIITLIALCLYGMRVAMMVTLIRVTISSLFTGTFLGPSFMLSLGGGVTSTLAMGYVLSLVPRLFSPVGLSVIGALFHNMAQLLLAYVFIIQRLGAILLISPFIILLGVVTGTVNGIIVNLIIRNLKKDSEKAQNSS